MLPHIHHWRIHRNSRKNRLCGSDRTKLRYFHARIVRFRNISITCRSRDLSASSGKCDDMTIGAGSISNSCTRFRELITTIGMDGCGICLDRGANNTTVASILIQCRLRNDKFRSEARSSPMDIICTFRGMEDLTRYCRLPVNIGKGNHIAVCTSSSDSGCIEFSSIYRNSRNTNVCYTSPLAFSMGVSKSTNNVFKSWCRMVGSQLLLLVMNVWFLRVFASSMGQFIGNGGALSTGQGSIFLWMFCALAYLKCAQRFDCYRRRYSRRRWDFPWCWNIREGSAP